MPDNYRLFKWHLSSEKNCPVLKWSNSKSFNVWTESHDLNTRLVHLAQTLSCFSLAKRETVSLEEALKDLPHEESSQCQGLVGSKQLEQVYTLPPPQKKITLVVLVNLLEMSPHFFLILSWPYSWSRSFFPQTFLDYFKVRSKVLVERKSMAL